MKHLVSTVACISLCAAFASAGQVVPGQVLVKIAPGQQLASAAANALISAETIQFNPAINWALVQLPAGMTNRQGIAFYKKQSFVKGVSENPIPELLEVTNDPLIGQQWHVNRIKLTEGWDIGTGSATVKIAILDTGVDLDHPDLQSKVLPGYDFGEDDSDPSDEDGHGTHVAGIAAAATNNGIGGVGVGRDCKILPVKVFGSLGGMALVNGITWSADQGAHTISMSLKISNFQALKDSIAYAQSKNVMIIAAAGNDGNTAVNYPAGYPEVMAVASSDPDDSKSGFSTYGNWVDVAAPGSNIRSTTNGGGYGDSSGTSMACPLVAGLSGLVWARGGTGMTNAKVWTAIANNCDTVPGNYVNKGRVNVVNALQATKTYVNVSVDPTEMTPYIGANGTGDLSDLLYNDNAMYTLDAVVEPKLGRSAGIDMVFDLPATPNPVVNHKLTVRAFSTANTTLMVWLKHKTTGKWIFTKSFPAKTYEQGWTISLTNMQNYTASDGTIQIRLRGHTANRNANAAAQFNFKWDQVSLTGQYEEPLN